MGPKSPKTSILGAWISISSQICEKIQIVISSDLCIRLTWNLTVSCGQQQTSWVHIWSRMLVKQFQDGGRQPFWKSIYRYISVKNYPILIKFCTQQQILNWMNWLRLFQMKKLYWTDSEFDRTYILSEYDFAWWDLGGGNLTLWRDRAEKRTVAVGTEWGRVHRRWGRGTRKNTAKENVVKQNRSVLRQKRSLESIASNWQHNRTENITVRQNVGHRTAECEARFRYMTSSSTALQPVQQSSESTSARRSKPNGRLSDGWSRCDSRVVLVRVIRLKIPCRRSSTQQNVFNLRICVRISLGISQWRLVFVFSTKFSSRSCRLGQQYNYRPSTAEGTKGHRACAALSIRVAKLGINDGRKNDFFHRMGLSCR